MTEKVASSRPLDIASLYALEGPDQGVTYALDKPVVVAGRSRTCDVVLIDPSVSRQHFQIEPRGRNLFLKNLSSKGTRVNGALVEEVLLGDGDVITIGLTGLRVGLRSAPAQAAVPLSPAPAIPAEEGGPSLAGLGRVMDEAAAAASGQEVMQAILGAALELTGARVGALIQVRSDQSEIMLAAGPDDLAPKVKAQLQTGSHTWRRKAVDQALAGGKPLRWTVGNPTPSGLASEDLVALGIRSLAVLGLGRGASGSVLLYLESDEAGVFSPEEFLFAKGLAAVGLAFLPRTGASREAASAVPETSSEPVRPSPLPRAKGWFVATRTFPASPPKCDFLDFLEADDGRLIMILAGVSGSGMSRALASVAARSTLKASAARAKGPADALRAANRLLKQDLPAGMFVSAAAFWLDSERRTLLGANAGFGPCHLWRDLNRKIERFHPKGIGMNIGPVALFDSSLEELEAQLDSDDTLLLFSDGLTEAQNAKGEPLGEGRLLTWMERGGSSPEDFLAKMEREWRLYAGLAAPQDDILMVGASADRRKSPRDHGA